MALMILGLSKLSAGGFLLLHTRLAFGGFPNTYLHHFDHSIVSHDLNEQEAK